MRDDARAVLRRLVPAFEDIRRARGFAMFSSIDRVYDIARAELGRRPDYDSARILTQIAARKPIGPALTREIGAKGYPGAGGIYHPAACAGNR
ncbi:MAG: hypothetical protein WD969_06355 [Paracoccaceae bacterium]